MGFESVALLHTLEGFGQRDFARIDAHSGTKDGAEKNCQFILALNGKFSQGQSTIQPIATHGCSFSGLPSPLYDQFILLDSKPNAHIIKPYKLEEGTSFLLLISPSNKTFRPSNLSGISLLYSHNNPRN